MGKLGSIIASCGHKCDDTVSVIYRGEECIAGEGFVPAVFYAEYCPTCAAKLKRSPDYFATSREADAWLDAQ